MPLERLADASFPVLIVHGTWDIAPQGACEIAAAGLHAICDVLVEGLWAERAAFPGAMHNPQLLGTLFNKRLREFLRSARPQARTSSLAISAVN